MAEFHSIGVKDVQQETDDTVVVEFDIPEHLYDEFRFQQGQYLTFRKLFGEEDVRRTYSICTSPKENSWKVAIKRIPGGLFSNYANTELKKGDVLEVMKPSGRFHVPILPDEKRNFIAFAAGSGITPILSIIKTHLEAEPKSTFKLFYLNRTSKSIIFKEAIEQLKNLYFQRFHVFYFLTRENRDIEFLNGRFDDKKINLLTQRFIDVSDTDHCFICGPESMIFTIRDGLVAAGMPAERIHFELFFSGDSAASEAMVAEVLEDKVEGTEVTLIDGGREFRFVMSDGFDNLLDGALAAGADLPYACKGGVCSTCKCKLLEGSVKMKKNYALEPYEVEANYILSCQSVPTSEQVTVDFDV